MYIKPELDITELSDEDVISTSNGLADDGEYKLPEGGDEFWG